MQSKPPIKQIADTADELVVALESLGLGTRIELSGASRSSVYVYAFSGDGEIDLKIRVSNHKARKGVLYHRKSDFSLIVPWDRAAHIVEEIKALMRSNPPSTARLTAGAGGCR